MELKTEDQQSDTLLVKEDKFGESNTMNQCRQDPLVMNGIKEKGSINSLFLRT